MAPPQAGSFPKPERQEFSPFEFCQQKDYNTSLFGCCNDPRIWLFSCCCTPIAIGCLNGKMAGRHWSCSACCIWPVGLYRARRKIQSMHEDRENEDASTWASICAPCCSLAQDYREWKYLTTPPEPALDEPFTPNYGPPAQVGEPQIEN